MPACSAQAGKLAARSCAARCTMGGMWRGAFVGLVFSAVVVAIPSAALAFPFGGRASIVLPCVYNSTIYVNLGPPRGGEFIWTTATKTYQFGPPRYAGQWLLGLAGAPYYCIYLISPLTIYTGIAITMMGSSGPAAPAATPTTGPTTPTPPSSSSGSSPAPTPIPGSTPTPPPPQGSTGKILIGEVHYAVEASRGTKPANEWIELFNDSATPVNIGGWRIEDAIAYDVLPSGITLAPGRFIVISAASTTRSRWDIPQESQFVSLESPIGDGLASAGDRIVLRNSSGAIVDAVSWGTNATALSPSAPVVSYGQSLSRVPLSKDTNTASDWAARPPSPGR